MVLLFIAGESFALAGHVYIYYWNLEYHKEALCPNLDSLDMGPDK
jgi:hypothetical protein